MIKKSHCELCENEHENIPWIKITSYICKGIEKKSKIGFWYLFESVNFV